MVAVPYDENGNPIAVPDSAPRTGARAVPYDDNGNPLNIDEPSIAARGASGGFPPPPADWRTGWGSPLLQHLGIREAYPEEKEASRIALRSFPPFAIPNAVVVGGQLAGDYLNRKLGVTPADAPVQEPFNPLESGINALGMGAPPDQSPASKTFESVAPFLVPTPATIGRVAEAPGLLTKGLTAGRQLVEGGIDWAGSDAAQEYAQAHGWGPLAQMIAGMVGTQVRPSVGHGYSVTKAVTGSPLAGNEQGGAFYDDSRKLGFTPPVEDVSGPTLRSVASGLTSVPWSGTGTNAAQAAQREATARSYNKGVQAIDPGAPSVTQGDAGTLNTYAEGLSTRARDQIEQGRQEAAATSNQLEAPIMHNLIDATPIVAALDSVINGTGGILAKSSAQHLKDQLTDPKVLDQNGMISFDALKEARSNINSEIDRLYPVQTGAATTSRQIGNKIQPVEDAMTAGLQSEADKAGVGPEWAANDAKWRQNSRDLHNLEPVTGALHSAGGTIDPATGRPRPAEWDKTTDSGAVAKKLEKAVKGNMPDIANLDAGMPGEGASALGQVLASKGTPDTGSSSNRFRPDRLATDYPKEVGTQAKADIYARTADPETFHSEPLQNIEDAVNASQGAVRAREPGGLGKMLGGLATALHSVGTGGAIPTAAAIFGGPVGLAGAAAARPILANMLNDPSFVRLVAGRRFTADNIADILTQYAQRAAMSGTSAVTPIMPAIKSGLSSIPLPTWGQTVSPLVEMLSRQAQPAAGR